MSADEMMDTGDYELYNPRVQGFRNRETVPVVRCGFNKIYSLVILLGNNLQNILTDITILQSLFHTNIVQFFILSTSKLQVGCF